MLHAGLLLHTAVCLIAVVIGGVIGFTTSNEEDRAEWRDVVLTWVVAFDVLTLVNVATMYWLTHLMRLRQGIRPSPGDLDWRVTWVWGQSTGIALAICYVMLFREKGAPAWAIGLTVAVVAHSLAIEVHRRRALARAIRAAPNLPPRGRNTR